MMIQFSSSYGYYSSFLMIQVSLMTCDGSIYSGWVYTIDPVTQAWALLDFDDSCVEDMRSHASAHLVMNASISKVDIVTHDCPVLVKEAMEKFFSCPQVRKKADFYLSDCYSSFLVHGPLRKEMPLLSGFVVTFVAGIHYSLPLLLYSDLCLC